MTGARGWAGRSNADMTGRRFGRWLVTSRAANLNGQWAWHCHCDCGSIGVVRGNPLRRGASLSCGCLAAELAGARNRTHGMRKTTTYKAWGSMRERCLCEWHKSYPRYGGRGIRICQRWLDSFESFLEDMGARPPGMSIDRKDNDGDYTPTNCRWATGKQQCRNKSNNTRLTAYGETKTIAEWMEDPRVTVCDRTITDRLKAGWTHGQAVETPPTPRPLRRRLFAASLL